MVSVSKSINWSHVLFSKRSVETGKHRIRKLCISLESTYLLVCTSRLSEQLGAKNAF